MKGKITWLHLSDLHFGSKGSAVPAETVLSSLLSDIATAQQHFDMIFVSGDIAYAGKALEYKQAEKFFSQLLKITGVSKEHLFLVPGNHDVERSLASEIITDAVTHASTNDITAVLADKSARDIFLSKFNNYTEFLSNLLTEERNGLSFTKNILINDIPVSVVGFNSAWSSSSRDEKGHIVLGEKLAAEAYSEVKQSELIITLMHHPPYYFRDDDVARAGNIIDNRSDFVLHGHIHQNIIDTHSAPGNTVHYLVAGATYDNTGENYSYNYVSVDLATNSFRVVLRLFDWRSGVWINNPIYPEHDGVVERPLHNSPNIQRVKTQGTHLKVNVGTDVITLRRGYSIGGKRPDKDKLIVPGIPKPLLTAIQQKKCFLFIGSGASADAKLPTFLELVVALAERVKDSFPDMEESQRKEIEDLLDQRKLMQLASYCLNILGSADFYDTVISQVSVQGKTSPTHDMLSLIPFAGVISVNYDTFTEQCFEHNHQPYKVILPDDMTVTPRNAVPVYKIRGTYDNPESIIILHKDMVNMLFDNKAYTDKLKDIFSNYTVLFYGFSFNDPDIDIMLQEVMYRNKHRAKKHYALLPNIGTIESQYILQEYNIQTIAYQCVSHDYSAAYMFLEKLASLCYLPQFNTSAIEKLYDASENMQAVSTVEKGNSSNRRFKIALSFPGEIRDFVEQVANALADRYGKEYVLYDMFHQAEFSRPNLDLYLQNLYNTESDMIVLFFCDAYENKSWCGVEWRAIRDLINQRKNEDRIMFVKCGEGVIKGIFQTTDGFFDVRYMTKKDIKELTSGIIKRFEALR